MISQYLYEFEMFNFIQMKLSERLNFADHKTDAVLVIRKRSKESCSKENQKTFLRMQLNIREYL